MRSRSRFLLLVAIGLTLLPAGCGPRGVGVTCTGAVKIDGAAAPAGIRVDFQPQGLKGSPSMGITDDKGKYELFFTAARKGVMPDECLVRVTVMPQMVEGIPKVPDALKDVRIPEHYGRQSKFTRTVKPGHNQIDIEIDTTSAPAKTK
ncbi:MAG: hypothetical protein NTY17_11095 [Planctomycetia bacterium]|nr:hypothetical protein [Planctomycetia bacterium]